LYAEKIIEKDTRYGLLKILFFEDFGGKTRSGRADKAGLQNKITCDFWYFDPHPYPKSRFHWIFG